MKALVTGASGFIGRELCKVLQSEGVFVRVLLRSNVEGPWSEVVLGDLIGTLSDDCVREIDTVIHLAGKAHAMHENRQDEEEYYRINTEGTRSLLKAAKQAGVKGFIYFSSVKAVGDVDGVMDESVSAEADTPYGRSKWASEKLVLEGGYVPHPVVIRPSMVYGNTEKGNLPRMIRAIRAGKFPPLPETHNRRSMVHVDDVVKAAILAAKHADATGKTYIVTDGNSYSTRQMYVWICEALHKPTPAWHFPLAMLKLMARVGDFIGSLRGSRFIFDSDALQKLTGSAFYSSEKIERELGFKASRSLREALPEIVQHLGAFK
jgi:nucleoside-diphosphate-sugar epimerase